MRFLYHATREQALEFSPFRAPSQTDECSKPQDPLHIPEEIKSDPLAFGARLGSSGPLLPS